MNMNSLPIEILYYTFEYLAPDSLPLWPWDTACSDLDATKPDDLLALTRVCRKTYSIARPLVYRTLLLQHEWAHPYLLKSLEADPSLGALVRSIYLSSWPWEHDEEATEEVEKIRDRVDDGLHGRLKQWLGRWASLGEDNITSATSLLVMWMSNLEVVEISVKNDSMFLSALLCGRRDIEEMFSKRLRSGDVIEADSTWDFYGEENKDLNPFENLADNGMPNLKEVRLSDDRNYYMTPVSAVETVLLHPGIETIRLHAMKWTSNEVSRMNWSHVPCSITVLQLQECMADSSGLRDILGRCKRLDDLSIELPKEDWVEYPERLAFDLEEVGDALREQGSSLTSFNLDTYVFCKDHSVRMFRAVGSLAGLDKLKHLKICREDFSTSFLDGVIEEEDMYPRLETLLPTSIETLYFRALPRYPYLGLKSARDAVLVNEILQFLAQEHFPVLREVTLELADDKGASIASEGIDGWAVSVFRRTIFRPSMEPYEKNMIVFSRKTSHVPHTEQPSG